MDHFYSLLALEASTHWTLGGYSRVSNPCARASIDAGLPQRQHPKSKMVGTLLLTVYTLQKRFGKVLDVLLWEGLERVLLEEIVHAHPIQL